MSPIVCVLEPPAEIYCQMALAISTVYMKRSTFSNSFFQPFIIEWIVKMCRRCVRWYRVRHNSQRPVTSVVLQSVSNSRRAYIIHLHKSCWENIVFSIIIILCYVFFDTHCRIKPPAFEEIPRLVRSRAINRHFQFVCCYGRKTMKYGMLNGLRPV